MKRIRLGPALLSIAAIAIGGWAFVQMIRPQNMLDMLTLFSIC